MAGVQALLGPLGTADAQMFQLNNGQLGDLDAMADDIVNTFFRQTE